MNRIEQQRRKTDFLWLIVLAIGAGWFALAGFGISKAIAEQSALRVTATVPHPPIWIETTDKQGITISTEDAQDYCYAHGLEMHECIVVPEAVERWKEQRR